VSDLLGSLSAGTVETPRLATPIHESGLPVLFVRCSVSSAPFSLEALAALPDSRRVSLTSGVSASISSRRIPEAEHDL